MNRKRNVAFGSIAMVLVAIAVVLGAEVLTRLLIPPEVFWPISNIYRAVGDPALGYTFRPNFRGTALGTDLATNRHGFRGPEWAQTPAPDVLRVAMVGDSIAFGFGVASAATLAGLLPDRVAAAGGPETEILNFGVNGYNGRQQRAALEFALGFVPDVVVLMPAANDHKPALLVDGDGWLHWDGTADARTRVSDRALQQQTAPDRSGPRWLGRSRAYLYFRLLLRRRHAGATEAREDDPNGAAEGTAWPSPIEAGPISGRLRFDVYEPLRSSIERAQGAGATVVLAPYVTAPDYRAMIGHLAQEYRLPVVDLLGLFPEVGSWEAFVERFSLGWDSHPGPEVQRRWVEAVTPVVVDLARRDASQ